MTDEPPNVFEQFAQQQMRRKSYDKAMQGEARRAAKTKVYRSDAEAPLVPGAQEKKQRDEARQVRIYRRHKRAEIRALLEGPYRVHWLQLSRVLRRLTIEDSDALVDYVKNAAWLRNADRLTRYIVLAAISHRIVRLRVINGYPEFDDSLPHEPPTAYETIRELLSHR